MQHATSALRAWMLMYLGTTLNLQWRANVLTHLLSLPARYFERRHLGANHIHRSLGSLFSRRMTTQAIHHQENPELVVGVGAILILRTHASGVAGRRRSPGTSGLAFENLCHDHLAHDHRRDNTRVATKASARPRNSKTNGICAM